VISGSQMLICEPLVRTRSYLRASTEEDKARAMQTCLQRRVAFAQPRSGLGSASIVAPIDGTILRVYARRGESFSTVTPRPLFSLADTSSRHIKAEIDERDVDKVSIGQKVVIQADALDGKRLNGSVVRISCNDGRRASPRAIHLIRATAISWRR